MQSNGYNPSLHPLLLLLISLAIQHSTQVMIYPSSKSITLIQGHKFALTCVNPNHHPNIDPQFYLRWSGPSGKRIANYVGHRHITKSSPANPESINLIFKNITSSDTGTYTCTYGNFLNVSLGSRSIILNTIRPVDFSGTPNKLYFRHGNNATLNCIIKAEPYPKSIIWTFNNTRIIPNKKFITL